MMLLLVVLAAAYLIWRLRTPKSQQRAVEVKAENAIARRTAQASSSFRRLTQRLPFVGGSPDKKHVDHIRTWINANWLNGQNLTVGASTEDFAGLVAWLRTLNEQEFAHFVQRLETLAADLGVTLDYAVDGAALPELKASTEDMMRLCAFMLWKTEDIKTLIAYQEWAKAPEKYKDHKFVDHLYANLVRAGLVTPNIDALVETEQQRHEHIVSAIRTAASQRADEFMRMLRNTSTPAAANTNAVEVKAT